MISWSIQGLLLQPAEREQIELRVWFLLPSQPDKTREQFAEHLCPEQKAAAAELATHELPV